MTKIFGSVILLALSTVGATAQLRGTEAVSLLAGEKACGLTLPKATLEAAYAAAISLYSTPASVEFAVSEQIMSLGNLSPDHLSAMCLALKKLAGK